MAITITQEEILKAKDYLPIRHKAAMASMMAKLCVRVVENPASTADEPLPDYCVEDRMMRQQCLMGVLAKWYLRRDYEMQKLEFIDSQGKKQEREVNFCMTADALDEWCESHPMNQLERLKKEKRVANKVYDLVYDFKAFENMLLGAIQDELKARNDPALRMAQILAVQVTPEAMKENLKALEEYRDALEGKGHE